MSHYWQIPLNRAIHSEILGETSDARFSDAPQPMTIIMNPGAENAHLAEEARAAGIEVVEDCTLVMLQTGAF